MTFDEAIKKLKSESAESKEIFERAELFAELCNEYGVEVKDGTGRIMLDGKDIDITSLFTTANLKLDTFVGRLTALAQIRETRTLAKNHANMQGNPAQQPYDSI